MNNKKRSKSKKNKWIRVMIIPIFIMLSYCAIRLGIAAGDTLFKMDSKIVKNIDTENFKFTLNRTLPIIDTVYNSGNIDISISGQISNLIKDIFNFDINSPLTILNAQSSYFSNYYKTGYAQFLGEHNSLSIDNRTAEDKPDEKEGVGKDNNTENPVGEPEENGDKISQDQKQGQDKKEGQTEFISDASSISFDETDEEKDLSEQNSVSSGKITLQNTSKFNISREEIDKLLKEPLKINFDRKGPKILVYHTHTTESYLRNIEQLNDKNVLNSSRDPRYNVTRVGDELTKLLQKTYKIDVMHNGTVHDYPSYNSSYSNSLRTIDKYLKSYPSIKITLDIHRDGLAKEKPKLRVVTDIKGKKTAKIMFVVGTNGTGLNHPNWKENLKLAIKLQEKLNEQHPGLAKPIWISNKRFNQHLATGGGLIVEIGADGNTLEEALESTKYLAKAINDVINTK